MHFHFKFLSFCLMALLSLLSIASAILEGFNVCTRTETYTRQVVVTEQQPYRVTETEWCWSFPPRCLTSRIRLRTVHKTQQLVERRPVDYCCEGFTMNIWEDGCSPECSKGCYHGTCVAPDQCLCEAGYGGPSCDIFSCPVGFWDSTTSCQNRCQCENNSTCDSLSGECRCSSGWTGEHCENKCAQGSYGQDCSEKCQCGNNGQCDHVSGECICKSGWMGSLCDVPCPSGKHGSECKSECRCQNDGSCDPESGHCFCQPGWTGPVCANRCPSEFWGGNCSLACDCNNGASCHHISGECECKPGFVGDTCSESCPDGTFGLNCTERCQCAYGASCSSTTGKCLCPLGWNGDQCKERNCPDGLWGPKCQSSCDCDKNNSAVCHPWTGVCECKPGWIGQDCSESLLDLRDIIKSASSQGTFYAISAGIVTAIGLLLVGIIVYVLFKRKSLNRKLAIKHLQYVTHPDDYHAGDKPIYQPIYSYEDDEQKKNNIGQVLNNSKITNNLSDYKHTTKNDLKSGVPSIDIDKDFAGKRRDNFYSPDPFKATQAPSGEKMRLLKNDAANPNVSSASEKEHIYEEIKDREVEYDELAHGMHANPQSDRQVTVSVMSPSWQFKPN